MEATGFVATDAAEDGGSVEFCGTTAQEREGRVRRRGREKSRTAVGQKEDLSARHPFPRMKMESKVKRVGSASGKQAVIVTGESRKVIQLVCSRRAARGRVGQMGNHTDFQVSVRRVTGVGFAGGRHRVEELQILIAENHSSGTQVCVCRGAQIDGERGTDGLLAGEHDSRRRASESGRECEMLLPRLRANGS